MKNTPEKYEINNRRKVHNDHRAKLYGQNENMGNTINGNSRTLGDIRTSHGLLVNNLRQKNVTVRDIPRNVSSIEPNTCLDECPPPYRCKSFVTNLVTRTVNVLNVNNTVFVDEQFGDDAFAERENMGAPYKTIDAAYAAALTNDTVYVQPGVYATDGIILRDNVNLYFTEGSSLYSTSNMFTANSDVNVDIVGFGKFVESVNTMLSISGASNIIFQALEVNIKSSGSLIDIIDTANVQMGVINTVMEELCNGIVCLDSSSLIFNFDTITCMDNFVYFENDSTGSIHLHGATMNVSGTDNIIFQSLSTAVDFSIDVSVINSDTTNYLFGMEVPNTDGGNSVQFSVNADIITLTSALVKCFGSTQHTDYNSPQMFFNVTKVVIAQTTQLDISQCIYGSIFINSSEWLVSLMTDSRLYFQGLYSYVSVNVDSIIATTATIMRLVYVSSSTSIFRITSTQINWYGVLMEGTLGDIGFDVENILVLEFDDDPVININLCTVYITAETFIISGQTGVSSGTAIINLNSSTVVMTMSEFNVTGSGTAKNIIRVVNGVDLLQNIGKVSALGVFLCYIFTNSGVNVNISSMTSDNEVFQFTAGHHSVSIDTVVIQSGNLAVLTNDSSMEMIARSVETNYTSLISYNSTGISFLTFVDTVHTLGGGILFDVTSGTLIINGEYLSSVADVVLQLLNASNVSMSVGEIISNNELVASTSTGTLFLKSTNCKVLTNVTAITTQDTDNTIEIITFDVLLGAGLNITRGISRITIEYLTTSLTALLLTDVESLLYDTFQTNSDTGFNVIIGASTQNNSMVTIGGIFYTNATTNVFINNGFVGSITINPSKFVSTAISVDSVNLINVIFLASIGTFAVSNITVIPAGNYIANPLVV